MTQDGQTININADGTPARVRFPLARLIWSVVFAFVAWVVLWAVILTGVVQFVLRALNAEAGADVGRFAMGLAQYLKTIAAYITLASDTAPFPLGRYSQE